MSLLSVQREGRGRTFVWLHGFSQTRDSAHQYRSILAGAHEVWTLDLPGHGSAHDLGGSLPEIAALIAEVLPDEPVSLGGYSFGARVALHVALGFPERVERLVLLGATRGIEDPTERAKRRERDNELARHIQAVGTKTFLEEWLAQPMFAALPRDERERLARSSDARGLAGSLRSAGTGTQEWLAPRLHATECVTLALAGSRDQKFLAEARAIATGVVNGYFDEVPNAGHAAHLEQPRTSAERVIRFLSN